MPGYNLAASVDAPTRLCLRWLRLGRATERGVSAQNVHDAHLHP